MRRPRELVRRFGTTWHGRAAPAPRGGPERVASTAVEWMLRAVRELCLTWINSALRQEPIIEPVLQRETDVASDMTAASHTGRIRPGPARGFVRAALALLALVVVLLRPVCDAFAASGDVHAPASTQEVYAPVSGAAGTGHAHDGICCSSVDADALTVPAAAPFPVASSGNAITVLPAILPAPVPGARFVARFARSDPSPPLSYHARSLRRLD